MNLYKISRINEDIKPFTFVSAVVCAESEQEARRIHPRGCEIKNWWLDDYWSNFLDGWDWAKSLENVEVEFLGVASVLIKKGVIVASFNAG